MSQSRYHKFLFAGLFSMLCILMLVAVTSINSLNSLTTLTKDIYEHPFRVSKAVLEINIHIVQMHRDMKDVVLAVNSEELEKSIFLVNESEEFVFHHFDIIEEFFLGEASRIVEAKNDFANWKPIRDEVIELIRIGQNDTAVAITKGKGADYISKLLIQTNGLIEFANDRADFFVESAKLEQQKSKMILYYLIASSLLFAIIIAAWLYRIITQHQEAAVASIHEKEVLIQEIHHRVKNNLQVIVAMLSLQSSRAENEEVRDSLDEGKQRIYVMAKLYELLHQTDNSNTIELKDYMQSLVENLERSFIAKNKQIKINLEIPTISLEISKMLLLGQITNEVISNSFKHAFSGVDIGIIDIKLSQLDSGIIQFEFSDNGRGFPENFDIDKSPSLGLKLVKSLTAQLPGHLELRNSDGASLVIRFERGS